MILKDRYYCQQCKKDVDVEVKADVVGIYPDVKAIVEVTVTCVECKSQLDSASEVIMVREL